MDHMNRRQFIRAAGASAGSVLLVACKATPQTYRYRLTLTATLNGKVRTGASVVEILMNADSGASHRSLGYIRRGEATLVRLDPRRALVALLPAAGDSPTPMLLKTHGINPGSGDHPPDISSLRQTRPLIVIGRQTWPRLVLFRDISDPASAVLVDPSKTEATLGREIALQTATIQTTTDEVTSGITTVLPWLANGSGEPWPRPIGLTRQDFVVGDS
jgi:hypothetical protein